jgi:hypothetical protein
LIVVCAIAAIVAEETNINRTEKAFTDRIKLNLYRRMGAAAGPAGPRCMTADPRSMPRIDRLATRVVRSGCIYTPSQPARLPQHPCGLTRKLVRPNSPPGALQRRTFPQRPKGSELEIKSFQVGRSEPGYRCVHSIRAAQQASLIIGRGRNQPCLFRFWPCRSGEISIRSSSRIHYLGDRFTFMTERQSVVLNVN